MVLEKYFSSIFGVKLGIQTSQLFAKMQDQIPNTALSNKLEEWTLSHCLVFSFHNEFVLFKSADEFSYRKTSNISRTLVGN